MKKIKLSTQVEIAVLIALGIALSYLKLFSMPQGGSVSLQMVPLVILAARHGGGVGVLAGLLFGVIRMLLSPNVYHPVQGLLDYPIAFMLVGVVGFRIKYTQEWKGHLRNFAVLSGGFFLRLLAHTVAGKVFFGEYAPAGINPWWYSITYNLTHLAPELIITGLVIMLLISRRELFEVG